MSYSIAVAGLLVSLLLAACSSEGEGEGNLREAPVESAEVVSLDTQPPQFMLEVVAGLPDACHSEAEPEVSRSGDTVRVRVLNRQSGAEVCAQVYGTYSLTIRLPGDYREGTQYTVRVNGETRMFTP